MRLLRLVHRIIRRFFAGPSVKQYIAANKSQLKKAPADAPQLLINKVHSYPPIELYAKVSHYLSHKRQYSIWHYSFESERLDRLGLPHPVLSRIFRSFGSRQGLSWQWLKLDSVRLVYQALAAFFRLRTKTDVLDLEFNGVSLGSLVYDSYLRRYRKETIALKSWGLLWTVVQARLIAQRCQQYFDTHQVALVIPGDVAYIYSGIVARSAILRNIPTYSIVEIPCRLQKMGRDYYRRVPYWKYSEEFERLNIDAKTNALKKAATMIRGRLDGNIDGNMAYMKQSAFGSSTNSRPVLSKNGKANILVLLHDFFDSPHIYRSMLFPDFWEWICFTLTQASNTPYNWYVKAHPNGLSGNANITAKLQAKFPNIQFIDPKLSNRQLAEEGLNTVFTVYGSAGHEFPYLSIPVVMAGDNPHVAYDFTYNPNSIDQYQKLIERAGHLTCNCQTQQLQEFYYMH